MSTGREPLQYVNVPINMPLQDVSNNALREDRTLTKTVSTSKLDDERNDDRTQYWMALIASEQQQTTTSIPNSSLDYLSHDEIMMSSTLLPSWTCRLCRCSVEFGSEVAHCQGRDHSMAFEMLNVLIKQPHQPESKKNTNDESWLVRKTNGWSCTLCNTESLSMPAILNHVFGKGHVRRYQRRRDGQVPSIDTSILHSSGTTDSSSAISYDQKHGHWICQLCTTGKMQSLMDLERHLQGKRHTQNKQRKSKASETKETTSVSHDDTSSSPQKQSGELIRPRETNTVTSGSDEALSSDDLAVLQQWAWSNGDETYGEMTDSSSLGGAKVIKDDDTGYCDDDSIAYSSSSEASSEFQDEVDHSLGIQAWPEDEDEDEDDFERMLLASLSVCDTFNHMHRIAQSTDGGFEADIEDDGSISEEEMLIGDSPGHHVLAAQLSTIVEEDETSFVESVKNSFIHSNSRWSSPAKPSPTKCRQSPSRSPDPTCLYKVLSEIDSEESSDSDSDDDSDNDNSSSSNSNDNNNENKMVNSAVLVAKDTVISSESPFKYISEIDSDTSDTDEAQATQDIKSATDVRNKTPMEMARSQDAALACVAALAFFSV